MSECGVSRLGFEFCRRTFGLIICPFLLDPQGFRGVSQMTLCNLFV